MTKRMIFDRFLEIVGSIGGLAGLFLVSLNIRSGWIVWARFSAPFWAVLYWRKHLWYGVAMMIVYEVFNILGYFKGGS